MVRRQKVKLKCKRDGYIERKKEMENLGEGGRVKKKEEIEQRKTDREGIGGRSLRVGEKIVPKMNLIRKIGSSL